MIKALTTNQNPPHFKELEHLKRQTTKLQCVLRTHFFFVSWCGWKYSYCYSYHFWCEQSFTWSNPVTSCLQL